MLSKSFATTLLGLLLGAFLLAGATCAPTSQQINDLIDAFSPEPIPCPNVPEV
jgi:hypothetical protein